MGEGGGSVRSRVPTREGNIVPEKAFSDTETPDKDLLREVVLAHGNKSKWIDLFACKYRDEGAAEARRQGEADVDNFFVKADRVHEGNHDYDARERMHSSHSLTTPLPNRHPDEPNLDRSGCLDWLRSRAGREAVSRADTSPAVPLTVSESNAGRATRTRRGACQNPSERQS
jgi:hypothetical protein